MACEFICDGCGTKAPAEFNGRDWIKPEKWFQRADSDGVQDACSRSCIEIIAAKSGKTGVVRPV